MICTAALAFYSTFAAGVPLQGYYCTFPLVDFLVCPLQSVVPTPLCVGQKMCVTIMNIHSNAIITAGSMLEIIATEQSNQHTYHDIMELCSLLADYETPCPHTLIPTAFTYCVAINNTFPTNVY